MVLYCCYSIKFTTSLRWPEPIYMNVGYVFDLRTKEIVMEL